MNKFKILYVLNILLLTFVSFHPQQAIAKETTGIVVLNENISDCRSGSCARTRSARWSMSSDNIKYVAVAVMAGTYRVADDETIVSFLKSGLEHFDVEKVKFFFDQNDVNNTVITFHVRG